MEMTEIKIKDNACYGVFENRCMMFHGTMSDCIKIALNAAERLPDVAFRIGSVGYDEGSESIELETPIATYIRQGDTIYVINELL